MKNNNTPSVVSNSPTPATIVPSGFTLGLDLGDRSHHVCVMDATGQIVREGALSNTRPALAKLLAEYPAPRSCWKRATTVKAILLMGHGNNGKDLLKMLTNDQLEDTSAIANTGIWIVEVQPSGHFKLEMFNDAPYKRSGAGAP
jgi:hypothetical protein